VRIEVSVKKHTFCQPVDAVSVASNLAHTPYSNDHRTPFGLERGKICELLLDFVTVRDGDLLRGLPRPGPELLHCLHNLLSLHNMPKDSVLAVQPVAGHERDEELGAVGVGAGVGHGELVGRAVGKREVLVSEFVTVNRLPPSAISFGEVPALTHEAGDDAVERRALVAEALLPRAQLAEVLGCLGNDVIAQLKNNAA